MAVPKKRRSKAKKRHRKSLWKQNSNCSQIPKAISLATARKKFDLENPVRGFNTNKRP